MLRLSSCLISIAVTHGSEPYPQDKSWGLFQALVELPSDLSITSVDVGAHETVASLAEGKGELTGLALWLLAERQKVSRRSVLAATLQPSPCKFAKTQHLKSCPTQNLGSRISGRSIPSGL